MLAEQMVTLSNLSTICLGLTCLYSIIKFNRLDKYVRPVSYHLWLALLVDLSATLLWYYSTNNIFLLHVLTFGEYILIGYFYHQLLRNFAPYRNFGRYVFLAGGIFIICNSAFIQPVFEYGLYNNFGRLTQCAILIFFGVLKLFQMTSREEVMDANGRSIFIVNGAYMMYFCGIFFVYLFSNYVYLFDSESLTKEVWALHALVNLIFYIILFFGLWKHPSKKAISFG